MERQESVRSGHIEGIHLPGRTWLALERENLRTLAELAAVADRIERLVPGIGPKSGRIIREQLARECHGHVLEAARSRGTEAGRPGRLRMEN